MESIVIYVNDLVLQATLIREEYPRLAICQDRIVNVTDDNRVIKSVDLLDLF